MSTSPGEGSSLSRDRSNHSKLEDCPQDRSKELEEIIIDTRMIKEIDASQSLLFDISQQIAEVEKKIMLDIDKQMDDMSSFLMTSYNVESSEFEPINIGCSPGLEHSQNINLTCSKVGGARKSPPNYQETAMQQENNCRLLPQREFGALSAGRVVDCH